MAYKTDCPECGRDNTLYLLSARVYVHNNIRIRADGPVIKGSMDVEDRTVCCVFCGRAGNVAVVEGDSNFPASDLRAARPVRELTADDLGLTRNIRKEATREADD